MNTIEHNSIENMQIGDIVAQNFHAAGVFKEFGIDFCCGGGVPLNVICEKKGISLEKVTNKLRSLPTGGGPRQNFNEWEPDFLIDYIINNHHTFVRKKVDEISTYAAKVAKVHGERHPHNVEIYQHFITLANEMLEHLESEEKVVFPLIKKMWAQYREGQPIEERWIGQLREELLEMEDEHEAAGDLMKAISQLSNGFTPPEDACATYRILYQNLAGFEEDLHQHVHLENNILFKKAEALLPAA
jgi:regulator of cell morphogenesis and NO signaling